MSPIISSKLQERIAMETRCPGQDFRKLRVELHRCPQCQAEVEIFSDEPKVRCQRCGTTVVREHSPSCINWCASARHCLGERRWQKLDGEEIFGEEKHANQKNREF